MAAILGTGTDVVFTVNTHKPATNVGNQWYMHTCSLYTATAIGMMARLTFSEHLHSERKIHIMILSGVPY